MKVYPVNALEAATLDSPQKEMGNSLLDSSLSDLYNRYIEFQVDFIQKKIDLYGKWHNAVSADCIIIGNTNARRGSITLKLTDTVPREKLKMLDEDINYKVVKLANNPACVKNIKSNAQILSEEIVLEKQFDIGEYITIINFGKEKLINEFKLYLEGDQNIQIGLLYIGETWTLPRFLVRPVTRLQIRGEASRTFSGQGVGIPMEPLQGIAVQFARIDNAAKKQLDAYISGVQNIFPHIVDPYPDAHKDFAPFFAIIESYAETEKREESGFFWDTSISYLEAK